MLILGLILGAFLGGAMAGGPGMLLGAALGAVLGQQWARRGSDPAAALAARVETLEAKVIALERALARGRHGAETALPKNVSNALEVTPEPAVNAAHEAAAVPLPPSAAPSQPLAAPLPPSLIAAGLPSAPAFAMLSAEELDDDMAPPSHPDAVPPRRPGVEMPDWARRLWAANTIVKVGLGMLFLGLAFLARYAAERVTVPIEVRLTGIGIVALALLGVGWRLRQKRRAYALLLQGGGVAVLYLTLFASAKFFGVIGLTPVFVMMVAIALLAAMLAVLQNAQAMAVLGTLGGYATPLLLSTGGGQIALLLGYDFVLGLGVAAVAWGRHWPRLNLMAFSLTATVAVLWGLDHYGPEHYAMAQSYLIAYWLLFTLILLLPGRQATSPDAWVIAGLLFGVPVLGMGMEYALLRPDHRAVALAALLMGLYYLALAAWVRRRPAHAVVFQSFLAFAALFATLVIPFALSAEATSGAWALEGAGAVWLGLRQQRPRVWASGLALMLLGALCLIWSLGEHPQQWRGQGLGAAMIAIAGFAAARWLQVAGVGRDSRGPQALLGWAVFWLALGFNISIEQGLEPTWHAGARLLGITAGAVLLVTLQARWRWPDASWPAALLMPCWLGWGLLQTEQLGAPLAHVGAVALPLAWLTQWWVLDRAAPGWKAGVRHASHAASVLGLALLGALQAQHWTALWGDPWTAWGWLGWLAVPALLLAALLAAQRRTPLPWPLRLDAPAYTGSAATGLALALAFWVLVANAASAGNAAPLPYLPLINPLDLGLAASLLALQAWLRSPGAAAARSALPQALPRSLALLAFLALNGVLIRCFHHWGGVPYHPEAWMASSGVQTGLALLWSGLALIMMWLSARRQERAPWLAGAGLLGAVVLKLMVFDLQGSGTVTRIVSFIGVGVLMLVIGYVAPLPGSTPSDETKP